MDLLTAKALREQRAPLASTIRQMADKANAETRDFTAEEQPGWLKANADYDALTKRIEIAERSEKVAGEQSAPAGDRKVGREDTDPAKRKKEREEGDAPAVTEEHRAVAVQAWMRRQTGLPLTERQREACKLTGMDPRKRSLDIQLGTNYRDVRRQCRQAAYAQGMESRTLSSQLPTAGAYTIPEGFVNSLEIAMLAFANMRDVADVIRTASGQDLPFPTANDTTNKGALLSENTAPATNVDPTFGQMVLHAYKYTSKIVLIPAELLEDSAFGLGQTVGAMLGERLGRIQADHFTTGDGASKPTGIVTASTSGVTAASSTAIAADEIYSLKHSVDPAYRKGAGWMMHDNVLLYIKKLKDGMGRYLWQSSLALGAPDTLDGDPITINQSMDSAVSGTNKTLLYGQLSKFKIRDVNAIRMRRLMERYADADQEGFVCFMRSDSNLLDAGTHPVKYLKQS